MIIAITYDKNNNAVFQHFGHTEYFYLFDTLTLEEKIIDTNGFSHHELVGYLKSLHVEVLICGGLGMHAINLLNSVGIEVIPGITGDVNNVINDYKNNKLKPNMGAIHNCSHSHN